MCGEFFCCIYIYLLNIDSNHDIWYNYGVNGIHGITVYNKSAKTTTEYVFRKNVFGDVTHIYKLNEGVLELAAEYKYDAWGKCIVTEVDESGIGAINPIRYRGYYFDVETGLYYLNARYYDPETGRFISADETKFLDPNTVNGLNLYAYCVNNPVMNVDPSGTWSWKNFWGWVLTTAAAVIATAAVVVGTVATGGLLSAVLIGAGVGALSSMGASINSQGGFSNANPWKVVSSGAVGAVIGAVAGVVSYGFGEIGKDLGTIFGNMLSNTPHLSSGITFGKIFGTQFLQGIGRITFGSIGAVFSSAIANKVLNDTFGIKTQFDELFRGSFVETLADWIFDLLCFLFDIF